MKRINHLSNIKRLLDKAGLRASIFPWRSRAQHYNHDELRWRRYDMETGELNLTYSIVGHGQEVVNAIAAISDPDYQFVDLDQACNLCVVYRGEPLSKIPWTVNHIKNHPSYRAYEPHN